MVLVVASEAEDSAILQEQLLLHPSKRVHLYFAATAASDAPAGSDLKELNFDNGAFLVDLLRWAELTLDQTRTDDWPSMARYA